MFGKILLQISLVQGFCVLGVFWLLLQFHWLLLVCSGFLLLLNSVLEDYMFLKIFPFHQVFKFLGIYLIIVISYNLCISGVLDVTSPFLFLILFIWVLCFSWWVWLKVCQFCFSFQRTISWIFLILWIVLLVSMSFNSALILIISFLPFTLGFLCCCSSNSCRCRVRLFIWNVSIFFR